MRHEGELLAVKDLVSRYGLSSPSSSNYSYLQRGDNVHVSDQVLFVVIG